MVIVGGGFAGVHACEALAKADVRITLIDKRNFNLFQPLRIGDFNKKTRGKPGPGDGDHWFRPCLFP